MSLTDLRKQRKKIVARLDRIVEQLEDVDARIEEMEQEVRVANAD